MTRIGLIQTCTGTDPETNARTLADAATSLAGQGAELIFTPEMCGLLQRRTSHLRAAVRSEDQDPTLQALTDVARSHGVTIAIGSLAIKDDDGMDDRLRNRSFVIAPDGRIIARYDKMHLFDVTLPDGQRYHESANFRPGNSTVIVDLPAAKLGLTICYDLRFPGLHAQLARHGAQIIAQPSSFTVPTGKAHWHVLLRARAIETGTFVVAAAQSGTHEDGRETYGHSLVVNPWGEVLLDMGTDVGTAVLDIDIGEVDQARARIPSLEHARPIPDPHIVHAAQEAAP